MALAVSFMRGVVGVLALELGFLAAVNAPCLKDANLVEAQNGQGHQHLGRQVRRGDDGGDDGVTTSVCFRNFRSPAGLTSPILARK